MDDRDVLMTLIEATGAISQMALAAKLSGKDMPIDYMDLSVRMTSATARVKELIELMDKDLSIEKKDDKGGKDDKSK